MVDCSLAVSSIRSRCCLFTIVDVVVSLSVSGIHLVLDSDYIVLFLVCHRDTVWDNRAIDKNFRLEKSIATQNRTN